MARPPSVDVLLPPAAPRPEPREPETPMIDFHYWTTPNGHKVTMFLEETGLPYRIVPVRIGEGEQFRPEFLAISPNNRIPAMVDHEPPGGGDPVSLFESGRGMLYLAEKTGRFIPSDVGGLAEGASGCIPNAVRGRAEVLQWLLGQMGGLGPMAGQTEYFTHYAA